MILIALGMEGGNFHQLTASFEFRALVWAFHFRKRFKAPFFWTNFVLLNYLILKMYDLTKYLKLLRSGPTEPRHHHAVFDIGFQGAEKSARPFQNFKAST